uniref:Uncharacterized protein n=1 Tax=Anopheles epiroticus TaxID=199890 RepID=A0A182PUX6_9DIPT
MDVVKVCRLSLLAVVEDVDLLKVYVSIDGLPIFNRQFWPILLNVHNIPEVPAMTIAVYSGSTKPVDIDQFLQPFVDELNFLMENGITFNNKQFSIELRVIIADSPARAYIKDNFDIIKQIIVADQLHLIDLGITKRMILTHIKLIEIHRKFRSLRDYKNWKGSEFSSFQFYASFVILKDEEQYKHFMLYFCSLTLFSSNVYKEHWPLANTLIQFYVKRYANIYGPGFISNNVHNLLHIFKEVEQFGPISSISSYPFENHLQHLKRSLRSDWKCFEQTINRLSEKEVYNTLV